MSARAFREARVNLGAISRNVVAITRAAGSPIMVVVKANGYGHGAIPSARAALDGGAEWLGVADIAEALELRSAGISAPVLAWLHDPEADFADAIAAGVDLGVSYLAQLDRVAAASGVAQVHLKVDTGLSRNGVTERDSAEFFAAAARHEAAGRLRVRGFFSHLANSGQEQDRAQSVLFDSLLGRARAAGLTPEFVHLSATGGALSMDTPSTNLARIGIGAYGLSPFAADSYPGTISRLSLTPAMELSAAVALVKRVPAGTGVSYGYGYRTTAESTLALVPLGYADGVPRHASDRGPVSINGVRYRVCGRIAMDQFVVDVGDAPVAVGDRAVLFGDPAEGVPGAGDWADAADTINYEIVTRIGPRVVRRYES